MSGAVAVDALSPAAILRKARGDGRTALFEHEVYALLGAAGFDVPRHVFWNGAPGRVPTEIEDFLEGSKGDDVVLKIVSPDLAHKSDVGGFSFSRKSPASVTAASRTMWEDVSRRAPAAQRLGILVVEKLAPASGTPAAEAPLS
ncbi:MAG: acetate--CoA ligase family protein, partial [Acidobacteriota bacterium]